MAAARTLLCNGDDVVNQLIASKNITAVYEDERNACTGPCCDVTGTNVRHAKCFRISMQSEGITGVSKKGLSKYHHAIGDTVKLFFGEGQVKRASVAIQVHKNMSHTSVYSGTRLPIAQKGE